MSQTELSVNRKAWSLTKNLLDNAEEFRVIVEKTKIGAILIDAGIKAEGGFQSGKVITEICLGGYGQVTIVPIQYNDVTLPATCVQTDQPAISTLGSQFADWKIKRDGFSAIGSGPARALVRKNKGLYEQIAYKDESDRAVLVLETNSKPPEEVICSVATECGITPEQLILILVPTTSVAGSTQVSGRIVETGLHKLMKLGLDPKRVTSAFGYAPIAPPHPKFTVAMGRTNDAILYCGASYYTVVHEDDVRIRQLVEQAPSSNSKGYGQPFLQIFKKANYDFYQVDSNLFAPAVVTVNNMKTGHTFKAGRVDVKVFKQSIGLL